MTRHHRQPDDFYETLAIMILVIGTIIIGTLILPFIIL